MSDQTDYDNDLSDDDEQTEQKPNWRRTLEAKAKKADEHAAAAKDAQKELAFYKAGLPMSDPRMAYFVKGYDGEFSADAIRKAATDAGFIQPSAEDTAVETEVAQSRQISDASAGATTAGKLSQADVLALARKAADAAPSGMEAQTYMQVLSEHGLTRMAQAPAQ